jgi:hypothetical protein
VLPEHFVFSDAMNRWSWQTSGAILLGRRTSRLRHRLVCLDCAVSHTGFQGPQAMTSVVEGHRDSFAPFVCRTAAVVASGPHLQYQSNLLSRRCALERHPRYGHLFTSRKSPKSTTAAFYLPDKSMIAARVCRTTSSKPSTSQSLIDRI